jgi:hypothetical protein
VLNSYSDGEKIELSERNPVTDARRDASACLTVIYQFTLSDLGTLQRKEALSEDMMNLAIPFPYGSVKSLLVLLAYTTTVLYPGPGFRVFIGLDQSSTRATASSHC